MKAVLAAALTASCLAPLSAGAAVKVAQGGSGAPCSDAGLAYCKANGLDDNGYSAAWKKNHCSRSPYGPRFEYLVPAWHCMRQP